MNSKVKLFIGIGLTLALLIGATALYNNLSRKNSGVNMPSEIVENNGNQSNNGEKTDAPDFTVFDKNGNQVKLSDFKGKPVVINFWATWCGYCKMEMPDFNDAAKMNMGVEFLMINVTDGGRETVEKAQRYVDKEGFTFNVYFDKNLDAANKYGASSLPITFFVDSEGKLVSYNAGAMSRDMLQKGIDMIK